MVVARTRRLRNKTQDKGGRAEAYSRYVFCVVAMRDHAFEVGTTYLPPSGETYELFTTAVYHGHRASVWRWMRAPSRLWQRYYYSCHRM